MDGSYHVMDCEGKGTGFAEPTGRFFCRRLNWWSKLARHVLSVPPGPLPFPLCTPMVALLLSAQCGIHPHVYVQLEALVAVGCFVYGTPIVWLLVARGLIGRRVRSKLRRYLTPAVSR